MKDQKNNRKCSWPTITNKLNQNTPLKLTLGKYISGLLLTLLTLFANTGSANSSCSAYASPSYDHGKGKRETVFLQVPPHDVLASRRHTLDGDGHSIPHHKKKFSPYIFEGFFLTHCECSKATISFRLRRLLEYYTFVQITSLFPKHGFW
jgi:hypothetical protein